MKNLLPPGVSRSAFDKACAEFRSVVGADWVFTKPEDLVPYLDPYYPGDPTERQPSAAIAPKSTEEVQAVVRIANKYGIHLWTVSTGKNYVYGGASPAMPGSAVLDLKRMKKIEYDEQLAYAIVEPGVSYFDLYTFLQEKKSNLWIDCPQPGWGSVLGNSLERGLGYTPYADHAETICGMEVVLADGSLLRTGMGAMTDNPTWPLFKYGFGPQVDGLFMQSNLGVVTRIGVWLMPAPGAFSVCRLAFHGPDDVIPVVDTMLKLRLDDVVPASMISNLMRNANGMTTKAQWYQGKGAVPKDIIEKMTRELKVPQWTARFGLYGEEAIVNEKWNIVAREFGKIPGAVLQRDTFKKGEKIPASAGLNAGVPTLNFRSLNWVPGNGAHAEQPPVIPMRGDTVKRFLDEKTRIFNEYGFDHGSTLFNLTPRAAINTASVVFDKSDPEFAGRARKLGEALVDFHAKLRYASYRGHIVDMDQSARQFDFNDNAMARLLARLKDELDPKGILAPGKQGVWPKSMRKR